MINKIITFILLISTILMSGCSVLSIINRPPVIDEFYLSKYVAYTGEPINASFKYNDPDGDNVYVSLILQKGVQSQYLISNTMLPSTTNVTYQFYIFYSGSYDLILELDDGKGKTSKTNTVSVSDSSTYDMTIDLTTYTSWYDSVYIYSYAQPGTVLKVISPSTSIFVQVNGRLDFDPVIKVADYRGIVVKTIDQNLKGYGESGYASSTGYVHYVWIYDFWLTYSGTTTVYISR